jgi:hypothetical protein
VGPHPASDRSSAEADAALWVFEEKVLAEPLTPKRSGNVSTYPPVGFWKALSADRAGVNQRLVTRTTLATPKAVIPDSITINGIIIVYLQAGPRMDRSANGLVWVRAEVRLTKLQ